MGKLFGTDGVRGVANRELTPETALKLGRAGAYVLAKNTGKPRILLGKDTRVSGGMLEAALTAGLCSLGASVYRAGVIPTPGIAYLSRKYNMDAGVMISASHNPMPDNGIKFFSGDGYKLPDAMEDEIEALYYDENPDLPRPEGADVGVVLDCPDAQEDYSTFLLSAVPGLDLSGLTVALDCANGAVSAVAPVVFGKTGADVRLLNYRPDGVNINAGCGSTHMETLTAYVAAGGVDIGLAFDGDGDRALAVDELGGLVDGDMIMAVCGLDMQKRGLLAHNALAATVMSNMGLRAFCRERGLTFHETAVGDRYVLERMLETGSVLGGETSGHIIFGAHNTTGDGILTGLQLLSVMVREGRKLSELKRVMEPMPQVTRGARVSNERKREWEKNEAVTRLIRETEAELGGDGRLLVRPSGTEPLVRVMAEGRDAKRVEALVEALTLLIERELS